MNRNSRRPVSQPPVNRSTSNAAASAAALAFAKKANTDAGLSTAAAAAALRSAAATPTFPGDITTKRMMRRGSTASFGSIASSIQSTAQRPGSAMAMQRRGSNASMSERTFRSPSPGGRNRMPLPASKVPATPPMPVQYKRVSGSFDNARASMTSPTPSIGGRLPGAQRAGRPTLANVPEQQVLDTPSSRPSVNFSRPMSPELVARPRENIRARPASSQGFYMQNSRAQQQQPQQSGQAAGPLGTRGAQPQQQVRQTTTGQGARPAQTTGTQPRSQPQSSSPAAVRANATSAATRTAPTQAQARPTSVAADRPSSRMASGQAARPASAASTQRPRTPSGTQQGNKASPTANRSQIPAVPTVPSMRPTGQRTSAAPTSVAAPALATAPTSNGPLTIPSPTDATMNKFRTRAASLLAQSQSPVEYQQAGPYEQHHVESAPMQSVNQSIDHLAPSAGLGQPAPTTTVRRTPSASPARHPRFAEAPLLDVTKHQPLPRSVSPSKPAMKPASIRTSSPESSRLAVSDNSDARSIKSIESTKKKKARFEETPETVEPMPVNGLSSTTKALWMGNPESMSPRPALPTFDSVRGRKSTRDPPSAPVMHGIPAGVIIPAPGDVSNTTHATEPPMPRTYEAGEVSNTTQDNNHAPWPPTYQAVEPSSDQISAETAEQPATRTFAGLPAGVNISLPQETSQTVSGVSTAATEEPPTARTFSGVPAGVNIPLPGEVLNTATPTETQPYHYPTGHANPTLHARFPSNTSSVYETQPVADNGSVIDTTRPVEPTPPVKSFRAVNTNSVDETIPNTQNVSSADAYPTFQQPLETEPPADFDAASPYDLPSAFDDPTAHGTRSAFDRPSAAFDGLGIQSAHGFDQPSSNVERMQGEYAGAANHHVPSIAIVPSTPAADDMARGTEFANENRQPAPSAFEDPTDRRTERPSVNEYSLQNQIGQAPHNRFAAAQPTQHAGVNGPPPMAAPDADWGRVKAYWSSLSEQRKRQLESEAGIVRDDGDESRLEPVAENQPRQNGAFRGHEQTMMNEDVVRPLADHSPLPPWPDHQYQASLADIHPAERSGAYLPRGQSFTGSVQQYAKPSMAASQDSPMRRSMRQGPDMQESPPRPQSMQATSRIPTRPKERPASALAQSNATALGQPTGTRIDPTTGTARGPPNTRGSTAPRQAVGARPASAAATARGPAPHVPMNAAKTMGPPTGTRVGAQGGAQKPLRGVLKNANAPQPQQPPPQMSRTFSAGSSDSDNSFRNRRRAAANGRATMRRSMRANAAPASNVAPSPSAAPQRTVGKKNSAPSLRTSMRDTVRPNNGSQVSVNRTPNSRGTFKPMSAGRTFRPTYEDDSSDDDVAQPQRAFRSRIADSDDEDTFNSSPKKKGGLNLGAIRGVTRRMSNANSNSNSTPQHPGALAQLRRVMSPPTTSATANGNAQGSALTGGTMRSSFDHTPRAGKRSGGLFGFSKNREQGLDADVGAGYDSQDTPSRPVRMMSTMRGQQAAPEPEPAASRPSNVFRRLSSVRSGANTPTGGHATIDHPFPPPAIPEQYREPLTTETGALTPAGVDAALRAANKDASSGGRAEVYSSRTGKKKKFQGLRRVLGIND